MENQELIEAALLFVGYMPEGSEVSIERHGCNTKTYYVFRCSYKSKSSGRVIYVSAKGESLPTERNDVFEFYRRQLTLTPLEAGREFSRIYFLERRAKQDAFINNGYERTKDGLDAHFVTNDSSIKDKLTFGEYA